MSENECLGDDNIAGDGRSRWRDTFTCRLQDDRTNEGAGERRAVKVKMTRVRFAKLHEPCVTLLLVIRTFDFKGEKKNLCKPQGSHFALVWTLSRLRSPHQQLRHQVAGDKRHLPTNSEWIVSRNSTMINEFVGICKHTLENA